MLTYERYLTLYARFAGEAGAGQPVEVTLDQLAEALFCSPRNVKLILRKLIDEGFVDWQAGRGRGNRSQLTFLHGYEAKLLEAARQLAATGEYKQAFELLGEHGGGTGARETFVAWLNGQFGYRKVRLGEDEGADMLSLPVYKPIVTLDPRNLYYAISAHMVKQIFDTLLLYDRETDKFTPSLAHAWTHDECGTEWTFHLRKGVQFHHGRELSAADVVYSLERLRGDYASGWFVRSVDSVEAVGQRTVRIALAKPNWLFPRFLCSPAMSIVPHDLAEQDDEFWNRPVGTGPFRFEAWTADRFELRANPGYFKGRAHLDGVAIVTMPADTIAYSKSWEQLLMKDEAAVARPESDWEVMESVCNGCSMLTWNMRKEGPQRSAAFRQAAHLLVDRARLIRELGEDRLYPAAGFHPEERLALGPIRFDPDRAAGLLRESGYDGRPIVIGTYGLHEPDARWLQRELGAAGIAVEVRTGDHESVREQGMLGAVDALLYCVVFDEDDVSLIELYAQHGNFMREHLDGELLAWTEERIDAALGRRRPEDRARGLAEIERRLREEARVLFLTHKKQNTFYNPHIKGVGLNSLGWIEFKDVWLDEDEPLAGNAG
ncbi:DNA-binding transcriptional regulator SgrR of sgrS sRNA, contains a MarR-type HTH domain and a solute-binding domain [Paenibacillus sp. UNC496MF]|uniref:ABC transporter substrate-binding protein n=1 Tax=Paenibacillus sp. UNC496MF TaxID=1502753 RepID=UPI0008F0BC90|nr:ABC transporter substrate-binding protein [Paenibacillus sp. UNC496MF]SFJ12388.1 DNA-binding transcriptional regulator SgrR of sgrS sRNA, contains a MarR-type HTH domain and a solute-binding domain [Paenibacillus sp. UNC496MF]